MIRLRDYVDTVNALKLLECFSCFEKVRSGFTKEMASEAKEKMKLGKKQTRKVYEIIRLHWTKKAGPLNDNNVEYKNYRVDVKKRLNIPYQVGSFHIHNNDCKVGIPKSVHNQIVGYFINSMFG